MTAQPTLSVSLFGTDEPVEPLRILRAGELTAELDAGNLRHIRYGGVEIIRAISFIVRDRNWGTYNPAISDLVVEEDADGFTVTYTAMARDDRQSFGYTARIIGSVSGELEFHAEGAAQTNFETNRTGFVVLHPIIGVSGKPVRIEHADGSTEDSEFPDLIDPVQPMMNLRALTHEAAHGLSVTCRMEGDIYEMEDQRNWTDASYKTYVRPLALPWPYTLPAGEKLQQSVSLTVSGSAGSSNEALSSILTLEETTSLVPPLGIGLTPEEADSAEAASDQLRAANPAHVVCFYNPQLGHGFDELKKLVGAAKSISNLLWLEAVVVSVDQFEAELADLGRMVAKLGNPFETVLVSPAPDLKCTLPGSEWPDAPPPRALFHAARQAFPGARLGGGMFSYFTEMNRKHPPVDLLDLVSFTTTATLHAGDDHSIMEGLESLPAIAASAAAIAAGKPFAVGPSAISMRMNPYGDAPMANPNNIRQAANFNDPRQRGLLGAAWAIGFFSRLAKAHASTITLGGATGAFGLLHAPQDWPQPYFDENGGLFPVYHVVAGLAQMGGSAMLNVHGPDNVEAIAAHSGDKTVLWLANRFGEETTVKLPATPKDLFLLDADSFAQAAQEEDSLDSMTKAFSAKTLTLPPYAVARLRW
ncbi:hypothetical protein FPY71_06810 [Aureimonas fodinaquatilis]|uniref:Uncharacterized protein n=1 Tax=Aureimonas fodinaquatilis TaxID=2565783 RepID=A0A5B0DUV9_9HYPH|nr:hypothetical protein [Aureimonas fodinaquatilis]KAA0970236.1 hypothetical protein FPY71_06810 [Aureimonas fodinaquatilis]